MGGVSAVSVAFLVVSFGRVAKDSVSAVEDESVTVVLVTSVVLEAPVGDVDASATGAFAAVAATFCVTGDVGVRVVGTLFAAVAGLGGCEVLFGIGGGECLLGGVKMAAGKPAPAPLTGIDGGGGGRNCDDRKLFGRPAPTFGGFRTAEPGPSTLAHT